MTAIKPKSRFARIGLTAGIMALALASCSTGGRNFPAPGSTAATAKPSGPPPTVQDCTLISTGSPSRYECNGKTYTTFDLAKLRNDYNAQQQSGK